MVSTDRIDGLSTSVAIKAPVRVATVAPINLSGLQTIDGELLVAGDRVLVKNQANPQDNGIYVVNNRDWTRAKDFDGARDAVQGTLLYVVEGNTAADTFYRLTTPDPVYFGESDITFSIATLAQEAIDAAQAAALDAQAAAAAALGAAAVVGAVVTGMDPTNTLDSTAALKAAIAASVARVTTAGNRYQQVNLYVAPGRYKLTDTITLPSYMSIITLGMVVWDFGTLATNKDGFVITNPTTAASSFGASSQRRPVLNGINGTHVIRGPGDTSTAAAVRAGNTSGSGGVNDFREVSVGYNVDVGSFAYGIQFDVKNTYMVSVDKWKIGGNVACIRWGSNASTVNSGEKIHFNDCIIVSFRANGVGVIFDDWDVGMFFHNCSFDFMYSKAIYIPAGRDGIHVHLHNCHIEKTNNDGLFVSDASDKFQNSITMVNSYVFPRDDVRQGTLASGQAIARQYMVKGRINFTCIGNRFQNWEQRYYGGLADQGVFFCDPLVTVQAWQGNWNVSWRQLVSKSLTVNKNYDFNLCTAGNNLLATPDYGWAVRASFGGLTAVVSTDMAWDGSANSIKVQGGGSTVSGDSIELYSDPIAFEHGRQYMDELIVWAGETTGSAQASVTMKFYGRQTKPAQRVVSITRSGTTATVTTDLAHGLVNGDVVYFKGADQADYNRKAYVTVTSSTTFTFYVPNSPTTPATATSPTVIAYEVELGGLRELGTIANNEQYGVNAADANYPRNATKVNFDGQTGNFTVGDIVTGGTSGATGQIQYQKDNGTDGFLSLIFISGTFTDNEAITSPSGGAALVNGAPVANDRNYWQRKTNKHLIQSSNAPAGTEFIKMFINWNRILNSEAVYMGMAGIGRIN